MPLTKNPGEDPAEIIPIQRGPRSQVTASIGMLLFLVSWGITFLGLFVAYAILREESHYWPPPGTPHMPLVLPSLNTAIALVSTFTFDRTVRSARLGKPTQVRGWLFVTGALGTTFLILQNIVWTQLWMAGMRAKTSAFSGMFYAMTWFHAAHVVAGLLVILAITPRALRGGFTPRDHGSLRFSAWFWHFVTGIWCGIFIAFYLV